MKFRLNLTGLMASVRDAAEQEERQRINDERAARAVAETATDPQNLDQVIEGLNAHGVRLSDTSGDLVKIMRHAMELQRAARAAMLATAAMISLPALIALTGHARAGDEAVIATETSGVMLVVAGVLLLALALMPERPDDG